MVPGKRTRHGDAPHFHRGVPSPILHGSVAEEANAPPYPSSPRHSRPRTGHTGRCLRLRFVHPPQGAAAPADAPTAPRAQPVTLDQALSEISSPALSAAAASFDGGLPTLPTLAA